MSNSITTSPADMSFFLDASRFSRSFGAEMVKRELLTNDVDIKNHDIMVLGCGKGSDLRALIRTFGKVLTSPDCSSRLICVDKEDYAAEIKRVVAETCVADHLEDATPRVIFQQGDYREVVPSPNRTFSVVANFCLSLVDEFAWYHELQANENFECMWMTEWDLPALALLGPQRGFSVQREGDSHYYRAAFHRSNGEPQTFGVERPLMGDQLNNGTREMGKVLSLKMSANVNLDHYKKHFSSLVLAEHLCAVFVSRYITPNTLSLEMSLRTAVGCCRWYSGCSYMCQDLLSTNLAHYSPGPYTTRAFAELVETEEALRQRAESMIPSVEKSVEGVQLGSPPEPRKQEKLVSQELAVEPHLIWLSDDGNQRRTIAIDMETTFPNTNVVSPHVTVAFCHRGFERADELMEMLKKRSQNYLGVHHPDGKIPFSLLQWGPKSDLIRGPLQQYWTHLRLDIGSWGDENNRQCHIALRASQPTSLRKEGVFEIPYLFEGGEADLLLEMKHWTRTGARKTLQFGPTWQGHTSLKEIKHEFPDWLLAAARRVLYAVKVLYEPGTAEFINDDMVLNCIVNYGPTGRHMDDATSFFPLVVALIPQGSGAVHFYQTERGSPSFSLESNQGSAYCFGGPAFSDMYHSTTSDGTRMSVTFRVARPQPADQEHSKLSKTKFPVFHSHLCNVCGSHFEHTHLSMDQHEMVCKKCVGLPKHLGVRALRLDTPKRGPRSRKHQRARANSYVPRTVPGNPSIKINLG